MGVPEFVYDGKQFIIDEKISSHCNFDNKLKKKAIMMKNIEDQKIRILLCIKKKFEQNCNIDGRSNITSKSENLFNNDNFSFPSLSTPLCPYSHHSHFFHPSIHPQTPPSSCNNSLKLPYSSTLPLFSSPLQSSVTSILQSRDIDSSQFNEFSNVMVPINCENTVTGCKGIFHSLTPPHEVNDKISKVLLDQLTDPKFCPSIPPDLVKENSNIFISGNDMKINDNCIFRKKNENDSTCTNVDELSDGSKLILQCMDSEEFEFANLNEDSTKKRKRDFLNLNSTIIDKNKEILKNEFGDCVACLKKEKIECCGNFDDCSDNNNNNIEVIKGIINDKKLILPLTSVLLPSFINFSSSLGLNNSKDDSLKFFELSLNGVKNSSPNIKNCTNIKGYQKLQILNKKNNEKDFDIYDNNIFPLPHQLNSPPKTTSKSKIKKFSSTITHSTSIDSGSDLTTRTKDIYGCCSPLGSLQSSSIFSLSTPNLVSSSLYFNEKDKDKDSSLYSPCYSPLLLTSSLSHLSIDFSSTPFSPLPQDTLCGSGSNINVNVNNDWTKREKNSSINNNNNNNNDNDSNDLFTDIK
jgi:hypothetical protein